jgi:hypothetical protein
MEYEAQRRDQRSSGGYLLKPIPEQPNLSQEIWHSHEENNHGQELPFSEFHQWTYRSAKEKRKKKEQAKFRNA